MTGVFEIESVAVPLLWSDYFTTDQSQYQLVSSQTLLSRIVGLGANDVRLIGNLGILRTLQSNSYEPFLPQSVASLKTFTDAAHAAGLTITWAPISALPVISGDPTQASHPDPTDPLAWFASFRAAVLDNARLAAAIGAERYMLFSDIEQAVFEKHPELTEPMVSLIAEVRGLYHGEVSVLVATQDGQLPRFPAAILAALDDIGLGLFPKLTNSTTASVDDLRAGWHHDASTGADIFANLDRLVDATGKKLWFADFAASSYDGSNTLFPEKFDPTATFVPDNTEQANYYEAAFRELMAYGYPWFRGVSVQNISRIDNDNGLLPPYLQSAVGENFYGKPGAGVLTNFFKGLISPETVVRQGSDYGETINGGYANNVISAGRASQTINGGPLADVIYSSLPGMRAAHQLVLEVSGVPVNGVAPTFAVRVNGKLVPLDFTVTTPLSNGTGTLVTLPVLDATVNSLEFVTTNWFFGGADVNRLIRVHSIRLDGQDLSSLAVYHNANGETKAFASDTNQGGFVSYDTSSLGLSPNMTVTLAANTTINGGDGVDAVVYGGTPAQYRFAFSQGSLSSVTKPGSSPGQGIDHLNSVEILRFGSIDYSTIDEITATGSTIRMGAGQTNQFDFGSGPVSLANLVELRVAHGSSSADVMLGGPGANLLIGGLGHDTLDGGGGADTASYAAARTAATVRRNPDHSLVVSTSLDGTDTVRHIEQVKFADGLFSFIFGGGSAPVVANFNPANGWASQDQNPRHLADVNGDGIIDIVGFGYAGVLVSFGAAGGIYSDARVVVSNFGQTAGWTSDNGFHRELADVNGDGRADILGFGSAGTLVSLAKADGTFDNPFIGAADFGVNQGWANQNGFARTVGDVNGDGKADIVGFGYAGTLVALGNGNGTFQTVKTGLANFGVNQGWASDNTYHRALADVNGDGKADLIGFGQAGTYVALSNGDGTFASAQLVLSNFGVNHGWASNDSFARLVTDVNGDHLADIVGFGIAGTLVSFGKGDGSFTDASFDVADFGKNQGWTSDNTYHREIADINQDGLADVIGFGIAGVLVGQNQGDFLM